MLVSILSQITFARDYLCEVYPGIKYPKNSIKFVVPKINQKILFLTNIIPSLFSLFLLSTPLSLYLAK